VLKCCCAVGEPKTLRGWRLEANDLRERNNGILEEWKNKRMECWNGGMMVRNVTSCELRVKCNESAARVYKE
jgi:hypothetical protein